MSRPGTNRMGREVSASPQIIAQIIVATWTKRARGAPLATRRNSVPERLVLPDDVTRRRDAPALVVHTVAFDQSNDFAAPTADGVRWLGDLPASLERVVEIIPHDDTLFVRFVGYAPYVPEFPPGSLRDPRGSRVSASAPSPPGRPMAGPGIVTEYYGLGAPARSVPLTPLVLRLGEWGQLRYLGRHQVTWGENHVYKKYAYNIGWLRDISPRIFVDTQPAHRYDSLPNVW